MATYIISGLIIIALIFAAKKAWKDHKNGGCGSCSDCSSCSKARGCKNLYHENEKK